MPRKAGSPEKRVPRKPQPNPETLNSPAERDVLRRLMEGQGVTTVSSFVFDVPDSRIRQIAKEHNLEIIAARGSRTRGLERIPVEGIVRALMHREQWGAEIARVKNNELATRFDVSKSTIAKIDRVIRELRENPQLDDKQIAQLIPEKSYAVLAGFVETVRAAMSKG